MTGYGKAELNLANTNFTIQVKSLNSKQIDATIKMPSIYREKEIGLRKLLSEKLQRGKIELSIWREKVESSSTYVLNAEALKGHYNRILQLKKDLGLTSNMWSLSYLPKTLPEVSMKKERFTNFSSLLFCFRAKEPTNTLIEFFLAAPVKLAKVISSSSVSSTLFCCDLLFEMQFAVSGKAIKSTFLEAAELIILFMTSKFSLGSSVDDS